MFNQPASTRPLRLRLGAALLGLAAFGFLALAPSTAHAQRLQIGDPLGTANGKATVTGSGTVVSGAFQYQDSNGNPATFKPTTKSYDSLGVYNSSVLTLANGSSAGSTGLVGSATLNVTGGSEGSVNTLANSPTVDASGIVNISAGTISQAFIDGNSFFNVSGGSVSQVFLGINTDTFKYPTSVSAIAVSGGTVSALTLLQSSTASISGGTVMVLAEGNTFANITGGTVNVSVSNRGGANITGGTITALANSNDNVPNPSNIDLFGTNLMLVNGFVTGTLQDNSAIDAPFTGNPDFLFFNGKSSSPVPEASTTVSFGLLLAFGLVVAARKKRAK